MNLQKRVKEYIEQERLLKPSDQILIACSGGVDSVVLAKIMLNLGYNIAIAHVNFKLRGQESEEDELFVRQFAKDLSLQLFVEAFETQAIANEMGNSLQLTARDLRYKWFQKLLETKPYQVVLTGHHLDDNIETILINQYRGTGIKGLCGIPAKRGKFVRPLLNCTRFEILKYAEENKLAWREDSSNLKMTYLRNQIRHKIIPVLKAKTDQFYANWRQRILENNALWNAFQTEMEKAVSVVSVKKDTIDLIELLKFENAKEVLFHSLNPYNFSTKERTEAFALVHAQKGKKLIGQSHTIWKEEGTLLIKPSKNLNFQKVQIDNKTQTLQTDFGTFEIEKFDESLIDKKKNVACLDLSKLEFPLWLRTWQEGDKFKPLGMKNFKKLSDFFIDEKVEAHKKDEQWVLTSGGHILWVSGKRISEEFKVTKFTENTFMLRWKQD